MKSILTVLFLSFFCFLLNAQTTDELSNTHSLQGIWQLYSPTGNFLITNQETGTTEVDETKLRPNNFYKIYSDKNELKALFISPVLSLITISGTYEVISPNQYVEHVDYHSNPDFANRDVTLDYSFISDDYLQLSYKTEMGMVAREVWKRLKQGSPNVELNKLGEAGTIK